jgi:hypothetical protein
VLARLQLMPPAELDDEQERGARLPLAAETDSVRHAVAPAADCSVGQPSGIAPPLWQSVDSAVGAHGASGNRVNGVTTLSSSEQSTEKRLERARAHPVRARALAILQAEVASPKQLADELGAPLGIVAYHVRVLASLNLIRLVDVTQRRGSLEHRYTAVQPPGDDRS